MSNYQFVAALPDLIQPEDYANDPKGRRIRLQIKQTPDGIQVLGDAMRPKALEAMLEELGAKHIEQMLCG